MPYVESESEFSLRQECAFVYIGSGNDAVKLFSNGATWKWGNAIEPPEKDSDEMRLMRYQFEGATLDKMIYEYRTIEQSESRQNMFHGAGWGPPANADCIPYLEKLAEKITEKQALVEELKSKLPNVKQIAQNNQYREQNQQAAAAMAQQLNALPRI